MAGVTEHQSGSKAMSIYVENSWAVARKEYAASGIARQTEE